MNVLAISAHPDDIEVGCAGTLAKLASSGNKVSICHVLNGELGHKQILPGELVEIRTCEAKKAAGIIGAEIFSLGIPDVCMDSANQDILKRLTEIIRETEPDFIITHGPNDYMKDHVEVGKAVFDASFSSSLPHYNPTSPGYDNIVPIYYMDTLAGINFIPTEYVDISDFIEVKLNMLGCHESQIKWMLEHDKIDFIDFVRTCSKYRGIQCGVPYAEGFTQCLTWPRMRTNRLLP